MEAITRKIISQFRSLKKAGFDMSNYESALHAAHRENTKKKPMRTLRLAGWLSFNEEHFEKLLEAAKTNTPTGSPEIARGIIEEQFPKSHPPSRDVKGSTFKPSKFGIKSYKK